MTPDPTYPPEFEALDSAFARALAVADGDVALASKLNDILVSMGVVSVGVMHKALMAAEREGVEPLKAERRIAGKPGIPSMGGK